MLLLVAVMFAIEHPWVLLLLVAGVLALVALDAWSVSRRVPDLVRVIGVAFAAGGIYAGLRSSPQLTSIALTILFILAILNASFYLFFARRRHPLFALTVLPLHVLFLWYSTLAFGFGVAAHLFEMLRSRWWRGSGEISRQV